MKRKFLEDMGLDKEQVDKILDENSQDIGKIKGDLLDTQQEVNELKSQIADRDSQLESLKKSAGDFEELKQQIVALQTENKTKDEAHTAEIKRLKVDAAVDAAIAGARGKNTKAIRALLSLDEVELADDGTVKGLAEQLEALVKAEDSSFLFDTELKNTQIKGIKPGESGNGTKSSKLDISKMTYSELAKYMAENPDVKLD